MNEIEVTAKLCHPYMNSRGDGCSDVVLKIPHNEVLKFQSVEDSKPELNNLNDTDLAGVWAFAFFSVLTFYCLGLGVGSVLGFLKRELR